MADQTVPVKYLNAVRQVLDELETTQLEAVEQAADLIVAALTNGGAVYCSQIGHGNQHDFLGRAGGLLAVQQFTYGLAVTAPMADCLNNDRSAPDDEAETVRLALRAGKLKAGDVMLLSSVSGRNRGPVALALGCREMGIKTIAFTSLAYTAQVEPLHPSGKKLCDVVDVVIDNRAPYGDAAVEIPGFDFKLLPVSGVAMVTIGWLIWGRVIEKMAAAGTPPSVFMSVNRKGGPEYNEESRKRYNETGY
jgi:uncharacterized phosphosugar-binding protein